MVAPEVRREEPATRLAEREMLEAWLDYHRATLLRKCAGLDADQLKVASCPPSSLSLLGLVRHMADIEKGWFADFAGQGWEPRYRSPEDPRGEFESLDDDPVADVFTTYLAECERSRSAVAPFGLDQVYTDEQDRTFSLRWVYLHMIEEYARHNGHADLIRERIDGTVGE